MFWESLPYGNKEKFSPLSHFPKATASLNRNLFANMNTYFSVVVVFHQILDIYWMKCPINRDRSIVELRRNPHTSPYPSRQLSSWHSGAPKISNLDPLFHKTSVCHVTLLKSLDYRNLFSFAFPVEKSFVPWNAIFLTVGVWHRVNIWLDVFFALRKWPLAFRQLQTDFCIFHRRLQFERHVFKIQS